ncbi:MAG TPA: arabinofuranosidase catalytic domain-containing protein, partial [Polyangia bacterium]|nr:arabinofuranosidase catalytic domain-containing protein [Polyangia bacterium]
IRPAKNGYVPMRKQGSIILGTGGDNSDGDGGQWFEGVMASGAASLQAVYSLQANIVSAGYGR